MRGTTFDEQAGSEQPTLRANIRRIADESSSSPETFEGRDKRDARPSYRPGGMEELPEKLKQMQADAKKQKERKQRRKEQRQRMSPAEKENIKMPAPARPFPKRNDDPILVESELVK